jgi:hypothetical protein
MILDNPVSHFSAPHNKIIDVTDQKACQLQKGFIRLKLQGPWGSISPLLKNFRLVLPKVIFYEILCVVPFAQYILCEGFLPG